MSPSAPSRGSIVAICVAVAVWACASPCQGAVPPPASWTAESVLAQQGPPIPDQPNLPSIEATAPQDQPMQATPPTDQPRPPRIVQVHKSWVETWAVGGKPPTGSADCNEEDEAEPENVAAYDEPGPPPPNRRPEERFRPRNEERRIFLFGDDEHPPRVGPRPGWPEGERRAKVGKHDVEPWEEINLLLRSYGDLIEFYEDQGRYDEKEQTLKERTDVCHKLVELRMLAEADGLGAAMQEYYRFVDRPDRAVELDIHNMEKEIDHILRVKSDLEADVARLNGQRDVLERKLRELNHRREQRNAELQELHRHGESQWHIELRLSGPEMP